MLRNLSPFIVLLLTTSAALAEPVISEFLAQNVSGLKDEDGESVDWIEIHNSGEEALDLEGYALTDSERELSKWKFPKVSLEPDSYLVVFASGKGEAESNVVPLSPLEKKRQRLLDMGLSEDFVKRMSLERLDDVLEQLIRRGRKVQLPPKRGRAYALHTNFKLAGDGEYLALIKPDGKTVCHEFTPKYPNQRDDISYGFVSGSAEALGRLIESTPGQANAAKLQGFVSSVRFSQEAGLFEEAFSLSLETDTPDAEVHYTLNGDMPASDYRQIYKEPLVISRTTILRVAAFKKDHKAELAETRTYLFLDDVLQQSPQGDPPPGWPEGDVNNQMLDYGMDPEIVGGMHPMEEVKAALKALPALSIVAPLESLFDEDTGIYVNAYGRGRDWERAASVELLNTDGSPGFQANGGMRMRGGFSRSGNNPKHGFRIIFRKEYGYGKLKYSLFGDEGTDEFDKIDLRSSMNYSWAMDGGQANTLLRDVFSRDTQRDLGQPYTRSRFYHLYLNGLYWGIYMTQERAEAIYGATYLGGDKEDYDTIKTHGEIADGNGDARKRLYQIASKGFEDDVDYFRAQGMNPDGTRNVEHERLIDIENVIDYMLITFYTGDKDGPGGTYGTGNNYFSIYNRENPDGFKFFEHDSEHSLGKGLVDMTGSFTEDDPGNRRTRNIGENQFNVHWLHTLLVGNSRYIAQFTKRAEEVFFEGGPLTPAVSLARLEAREKTIDQAIIAHSARWGDAASGSARTRETWLGGVQEIKEFIATRNDTLIRQLHGRGWYTGLPAPRFNRKDDLVGKGFKWFVVGGEGEIYVTTDGSDPRDAEGKPSATAKLARIPQIEHTTLLGSPVPARAWVPQDGLLGLGWIQPGFDDSMWIDGQTGIGYEGKSGYEDLIGIDLEDAMLDLTTTAYMRTHFQIADPSTHAYDELHLKMRYDDGFIAYLNGERIAAENAPPDPNWQSAASADHPDAEAEEFVAFPIDHAASLLREGDNVLAIHGMDGVRSSDFIITPEIEGLRYTGADPISLNPGQTTIRARSRKDDKWSPMVEALVEMK